MMANTVNGRRFGSDVIATCRQKIDEKTWGRDAWYIGCLFKMGHMVFVVDKKDEVCPLNGSKIVDSVGC